jgi:beta-lactamase class A
MRFGENSGKHYVVAALLLILGGTIVAACSALWPTFFCGRFNYIDPMLSCGPHYAISKGAYLALHSDVQDFIAKEKAVGAIDQESIFFRDLNNGPTLEVSSYRRFAPASLLKLPLIIALFSIEENNPGFLKTKLPYDKSALTQIAIPDGIQIPAAGLIEGQSYTLEQLAQATIKDSDNLAYYILVNYMDFQYPGGSQALSQSFQEMGIIDPRNPDEEVVTTKGYAGLIRLLYSVAYLNPQNSEEILSWMAKSSFREGLVAGVPQSVTVANKYGERDLSGGSLQYHDCGIVYYPDNPYILCIMTQGTNEKNLIAAIASTSQMVYQAVDARHY